MLQLVFTPQGAVELLDGDRQLWASDADDDFTEEFGKEFFNVEDEEDIMDYLVDQEIVPEDAEYDVIEQSLNKEDLNGPGDEDEEDDDGIPYSKD